MIDQAIGMIEAQQKKEQEGSAPWVVGEQLKELCRRSAKNAELIAQDLQAKEMSIREAEKKIKEYADQHRTGNFAFVSPMQAEKILREFYGLPEEQAEPAQEKTPDTASGILLLDDFL